MGDNENRKVYEPRIVKNYREMIEYSVKNYADKIAYKYKKNGDLKHVEYVEKTYEQVGRDIKAFATELLNKGLEHRKIVLIGNNRYEWCISYLAVTSANMIIVPLDKALPDNEIENLVTRSEADVAIFDKKYIVIEIKLVLYKGNYDQIKEKMDEYKKYRIEKQPIEYPSAGSTFKRGTNYITAKLIDEANLKGYTIGGAQVSEKHAGFIINKGNATAKDILELIEYVKEKVYETSKEKIDLEVEIVGEK